MARAVLQNKGSLLRCRNRGERGAIKAQAENGNASRTNRKLGRSPVACQTGDKKSDRWDFFGNPKDFVEVKGVAIPFYNGGSANMPAACTQAATSIGTAGPGGNLAQFGCFAKGNSVLIAPPTGTFGTASRNMFRGYPFNNWDFSVFKNTMIKERITAQFRAEFFNFLNHPIMANASGNISSPSTFGCGCDTPDQAGQNPVLGSGGARVIQLGLKMIF
jgi:hypothetical protein